MKHMFQEPCGKTRVATANLIRHRDGLLLANIHVPEKYRGLGVGTKLLKRIIQAADDDGRTLYLIPSSSGVMSDKELIAWYSRHGFEERNALVLERVAKEKASGQESTVS